MGVEVCGGRPTHLVGPVTFFIGRTQQDGQSARLAAALRGSQRRPVTVLSCSVGIRNVSRASYRCRTRKLHRSVRRQLLKRAHSRIQLHTCAADLGSWQPIPTSTGNRRGYRRATVSSAIGSRMVRAVRPWAHAVPRREKCRPGALTRPTSALGPPPSVCTTRKCVVGGTIRMSLTYWQYFGPCHGRRA